MRSVACAILLAALPAHAFVRSQNNAGICVWWKAHGHNFQIDAQGTPDVPNSASFDAIRKSLATWGAVSCSDLTFPEEALSTDPKNRVVGYFDSRPNHNLVLFRTQACRDVVPAGDSCRTQGGCSNLYDCWDQGDGVIASTTTTSNSRTGEIVDSDIELNDAPFSSGAQYTFTAVDGLPCTSAGETGCVRIDVQNTVTHEAGHSLGLDHTPDPRATMYASAPQGETSKRVLGTDDIQGICAIYPAGKASVTCTAQQPDSGGCGCSHDQTGSMGTVLAAALLLLHIRRRSSRRPQLAISSSTNAASAPRSQSGIEN